MRFLADDPLDDQPPAGFPVQAVSRGEADVLAVISLDFDGDGREDTTLRSTTNHPFWTREDGWVEASDLQAGDRLKTPDGREPVVRAAWKQTWRGKTWDLTIGDSHSYFVLAGGVPVLVHNTNPGPRTWIAYELTANLNEGCEIKSIRNIDKSPVDDEAIRIQQIKDFMSNKNFYYGGIASQGGVDVLDGIDVLKQRYRKGPAGIIQTAWVRIPVPHPGIPYDVKLTIPMENGKVLGRWFDKGPSQEDLYDKGKRYSEARQRAMVAERIIVDDNGIDGVRLNLNTPLNGHALEEEMYSRYGDWKCGKH